MQLLTTKGSIEYVLKYLHDKYGYLHQNLEEINLGRYFIVYGMNKPNIAICLKKDFLMSYGELAKKHNWVSEEGILETGLGETLNKADIRLMLQRDVKLIYIVYNVDKIYMIPLAEFLINGHQWTNKENKEVISISIHRLLRV